MANIFWVASHTPVEVAQLVIGYLRSFRSIAYLNKAWHSAVCGLADSLYERFLDSKFSVDMLRDNRGRSLLAAGNVNIRVNRKLQALGVENQDIIVRFWYTAQLYFHRFCGANLNELNGGRFQLRDIFLHCGRNSDIGKSYNFRQLLAEFDDRADGGYVRRCIFAKKRFVMTRDLGCPLLGCTVREVFQTIHCMIWGGRYCEVFCECKEPASPSCSEVDSDERCSATESGNSGYSEVDLQVNQATESAW